jgi:hypothetical protein
MPRKPKAEVAEMETTTSAPPIDNAHVAKGAEKFTNPTSFTVLNSSGGEVRVYSHELHGENAEALAKQYAGKIGGEVK